MDKKFSKAERELYEMVVSSLEEGVSPWEKPWNSPSSPQNALSKNEYQGINRLYLSLVILTKGYKEPRFMTFKQMVAYNKTVDEELRIRLPKGTRGYGVEFFSIYHRDLKKNISFSDFNKYTAIEQKELLENNIIYFNKKSSTVFNIEQFEGNFPEMKQEQDLIDPDIDMIKGVAKEMNLKLKINENSKAYYTPSLDAVHLPDHKLFKTEEGFYKTAFHEFAHATSHPSRLNREMASISDIKAYAEEELRAEFTSLFLSQKINLPLKEEIQQSSSYLESWLQPIKDNPNILFESAKVAVNISDYLHDKTLDYVRKMKSTQIQIIDEKLVSLKPCDELEEKVNLNRDTLNAMKKYNSIDIPKDKINLEDIKQDDNFNNLKNDFANELTKFFSTEFHYEILNDHGLDFKSALNDVSSILNKDNYDAGLRFFDNFKEELEAEIELDM